MRPRITDRGWEIPIDLLPARWRAAMISRFSLDDWAGVVIVMPNTKET